MTVPVRTEAVVPVDFDPARFTDHARTFLTEWLLDFTWGGQPLTGAITAITARVEVGEEPVPDTDMTLWTGTGSGWLDPAEHLLPDPATGMAMSADCFHETWYMILDAYRLAGTWLHPDTLMDLDPYAWAMGRAALAIGTRDRSDPNAPRRYDPDRRSDLNDLGVINFPVRAAFRAPEWIAEGHSPDRTCLYVIATALAEGGVHEAMEMHQSTPGQPIWDPHARVAGRLSLTVTFADGTVSEGAAH
jgi:hypothetical protein